MNLWGKYKNRVMNNCTQPAESINSLGYWRDYMFANTIIYMLPLSLIALIPGILVSLQEGLISIALFDIGAVISLPMIALAPGISVTARKIIFCIIVYILAFVLLNALGSFGPGLVYLLGISVFMILILPKKYSFAPVYLNILFCVFYGLIIYLNILDVHQSIANKTISWIAISTNLIFLTAVFSVLIPRLFTGMQKTFEIQTELQEKLNDQNKELESSLLLVKETNKELEQFAYIASHDLQEPLRTITSFLLKIEERYEPLLDERGKKYIELTVDGAKRMRRIILDLLEYSRTSFNELKFEEIDINEIIREVTNLHQKSIEEKQATILYKDLPIINCAKSPILQLFGNLIGNSLKYSKADVPPVIEIGYSETSTHWEFSVKDNGIGISPEFHDKVFLLFQRLHNKSEYSGTGIGLAVCKKIVQRLGGEIQVASENEGTCFKFTVEKRI